MSVRKGYKWSKDIIIKRAKASAKARMGMKLSEKHKEKLKKANLGYKPTKEALENLSKAMKGNKNGSGNKGRTGERAAGWRGGKTKESELIRTSSEYKLWRKAVYERDRWTCVWCGYRSKKRGDIHADHIKPFSLFPELRFAIDNGRTLCVDCHKKTYSYLNNKTNKIVYQEAV